MATTRKWGIITDVSNITGGILINSLSFEDSAETAEARDDKGRVVDLAAYSRQQSVTIQGLMDTAKGTLATAGSKLTLDGKDWIIESVSKQQSNQDFVRLTVTAKSSDNAIITIIGEQSSSSSAQE